MHRREFMKTTGLCALGFAAAPSACAAHAPTSRPDAEATSMPVTLRPLPYDAGALAAALSRDFGSFARFKEEFAGACVTQFSSGWG